MFGIPIIKLPDIRNMRARNDQGVPQYSWFCGEKCHYLIVPIHFAHIGIIPLHNRAERAIGISGHRRVLPCDAHVVS